MGVVYRATLIGLRNYLREMSQLPQVCHVPGPTKILFYSVLTLMWPFIIESITYLFYNSDAISYINNHPIFA